VTSLLSAEGGCNTADGSGLFGTKIASGSNASYACNGASANNPAYLFINTPATSLIPGGKAPGDPTSVEDAILVATLSLPPGNWAISAKAQANTLSAGVVCLLVANSDAADPSLPIDPAFEIDRIEVQPINGGGAIALMAILQTDASTTGVKMFCGSLPSVDISTVSRIKMIATQVGR
jgi:hypothetical protein